MMKDVLGSLEYQLLSVLMREPSNAYGASIQERIRERGGRDLSLGAIYTALERLEKKGFVSSSWGEATPERGGRRKRYYRIEGAGVTAVRHSERVLRGFATRAVAEGA